MDKAEEKFILSEFQNNYANFPEGKLTQPDKPDFLVEGERIIGIEVTQVFKDQDFPSGSIIKAKNTFQRHLLTNAVSDLKSTNFPKCLISVDLNDSAFSTNLNAREIGKLWFADIIENKNYIRDYNFWEFTNEGQLPIIIDSYTIYTAKDILETDFVQTGGAIGNPLNNDFIQFILNKKEKAKREFRKCDSFWLLIKEGSLEADYFGVSTIENSKLVTSFDKVFLLRHRNTEIVELK